MKSLKDEGGIELISIHTVHYNDKTITVEYIYCDEETVPHYYFFVQFDKAEFLLSKKIINNKLFWIGRGSPEEMKLLGECIELQTGIALPLPPSLNPFEYTGDVIVEVKTFFIDGTKVEKSKSPFTDDIYYRLAIDEDCIVVVVHSKHFKSDERIWLQVTPLDEMDFNFITEMIEE